MEPIFYATDSPRMRSQLNSWQLLRRLMPALTLALVNDGDWLSRPCVDAISGFATSGGIFRSRVGLRMAYCDLLVSGFGVAWHI